VIKQFAAFVILFTLSLASPRVQSQPSPPVPELEGRLTLLTGDLHEGDHFKVRAEIENVSDHTVIVWKNLRLIHSVPFTMGLWLEDSAGNKYLVSPPATADFFEETDLQLENGILKWQAPLSPRTFIGSYFDLELKGVPPGKYRLFGNYTVNRQPHKKTDLESTLLASNVSIFEGIVAMNSIDIEVLPRRK
jgi:hypothetical protein